MLDIGRRLTLDDKDALKLIASHLKNLKALSLAAEVYRKLGNESEVIQLHIETQDWTEAFRLSENLPDMLPIVHLQYAKWLAESDQFVAAHKAFVLAGKPKEATQLLIDLVECSINEERYLDAGYYNYLRAKQLTQFMTDEMCVLKSN